MVLQEVGWWHVLDRSGSGQGRVEGTCERGNETCVSRKRGKFLG
jgi:hypothetical protein